MYDVCFMKGSMIMIDSVSRLKKKNCKYEYENFSYLEKNEIWVWKLNLATCDTSIWNMKKGASYF